MRDIAGGPLIGEFGDVRPRRERLLTSGDDHGFHVRITSKLSCDIAQRTEQRSRQRIHRRTVESQRHDAAVVTFHQYEVVGHAPRRY